MATNWDDFAVADAPQTSTVDWSQFSEAPQVKQNKSVASDLGTDLKRGVEGLPGLVTGLVDLPAGLAGLNRPADRVANYLGEKTGFQPAKWKDEAAKEYSTDRQAARADIDQAWEQGGVGNIASAYARNPMATAGNVVESVPSMAAGGFIGRGLATVGKFAPVLAGAIGEGAVTAGQNMDQTDRSVDPTRAALSNLVAGGLTGAIGFGAGKIASKLGLEDVQTAMAGGHPVAKVDAAGNIIKPMGLTKRVAGGMVTEGVLQELPQSMQEQAMQNVAEGKPIGEGVGRAGVEGALAGAAMGGGFNLKGADTTYATAIGKAQDTLADQNAPYEQRQQALDFLKVWKDNNHDAAVATPWYQGIQEGLIQDQMAQAKAEEQAKLDAAPVDLLNTNYGGLTISREKGLGAQIPLGTSEAATVSDEWRGPKALQDEEAPGVDTSRVGSGLGVGESVNLLGDSAGAPARPARKGTVTPIVNESDNTYGGLVIPKVKGDGAQIPLDTATAAPNTPVGSGLGVGANDNRITSPYGISLNTGAKGVVTTQGVAPNGTKAPQAVKAAPQGSQQQPAAAVGPKLPSNAGAGLQGSLFGKAVRYDRSKETSTAETPVPMDHSTQGALDFGKGTADEVAEANATNIAPVTSEQRLQQQAAAPVVENLPAVAPAIPAGLKLTEKQQPVYQHIQTALAENRIDEIVDSKGTIQYQKIAEALGMERGSAKSFIDQVARRIAVASGHSVKEFKQALKDRVASIRTTAPSDQSNLGMSPALQANEISDADVFGAETGAEQSMGIISSIGGSQGEIGNDEALPPSYKDSVEPSAKAKAEAEVNRTQWEVEAARLLSSDLAITAGVDWNDARSESTPAWDALPLLTRAEFVLQYNEQLENDSSWASIEQMQHQFEQDLGDKDVQTTTRRIQDTSTSEGEQGTREEAGGSSVAGQDPVPGTPAQTPANPLEARLEKLKPFLGGKQKLAVKKWIKRYSDGDITLERLVGELENYEQQVTDGVNYSESNDKGSQATTIAATLKKLFFSPEKFGKLVTIVQSYNDLPDNAWSMLSQAKDPRKVQGFATADGKVYLIADNIAPGRELGVFLHEVGVHLGMERLIGKHNMQQLSRQIAKWSVVDNGAIESKLAKAAMDRVKNSSSKNKSEEALAYFIEEAVKAGIDPQAIAKQDSALGQWFRTLWAAAKVALRKLGLQRFDQLTAQHLVDLAYGSAKMELTGETTAGEGREASELRASIAKSYSFEPSNLEDKIANKSDAVKLIESGAAQFSEAPAAVREVAHKIAGRSGQVLVDLASTKLAKMSGELSFLYDLVDNLKGKLPSAGTWYKSVMDSVAARKAIETKAEAIASAASNLKNGTKAVNDFISKSTFDQKWGYDPKFAGRTVTVDPDMRRAFNALTPAEQAVAKAVFAHGEEMRDKQHEIMKLLGLTNPVFMGSGKLEGPYAPLKRFGDSIAHLKSKELIAAEEANDAALVSKLKADPAHYEMRKFDNIGLANAFRDENQSKWFFADAFEGSERASKAPMNGQVLQQVLSKMKMDKDVPAAARAAMTKLVQDMYFQAQDEHSARTSGLKRLNRAGYDEDMIRAFLSHARAEAGFLANMEHGGAINDAFYKMQNEAKDPKTHHRVGQDAFNALAAHYAENLNYAETPWQDRAMAFTSAMQLATSVGYHLNNMMQPAMVTVPRLAADFNNYSGAWGALVDGYKTLAQTGVKNLNLANVKNVGLRSALQAVQEANLLSVGMMEDLGHFEATKTGIAGVDKVSDVARSALHLLRQTSALFENMNRVAAATAAYNMSIKAGKTQADAEAYAVSIVRSTQGDTSRINKPMILKRLPKFMGQYKGYQFMMAAAYSKAFKQTFEGVSVLNEDGSFLRVASDTESKSIRAMGRRMLAYKLFHTTMAAGVLGMPLMNLVAMTFAGLGDDDEEPKNLERTLRESGIPQWMLHGPLAAMGLDMSAKLGDDKIFSIIPYGTFDVSSAAGLTKTAASIAGPAVSQAGKMADGVGAIKNGDYYKGLEKFMPKGVESAMKAWRIANEGYTLKNGDLMFKPEDISGLALAFDALGMPSSELKKMDWLKGQQYEIKRFYIDNTKQLEHDYAKAYKDGDSAKMSELRQDWMDLQSGKDHMRRYFGDSAVELKRQPISNMLKYPHTTAVRERKLQRSAQTE